ncbi:30S ribosomal protein S6 [Candidatus Velamenicoccus archaeovorus]|uniref:Small ribosomal subunit protein bS6 n=1 Tax=Velamenicoccus archaeovorus TaxID=1930593 RepID=A0A410P2B9_VELA1|nr:30S ribosomal protein S6 [Candidatus Velamenicoccus archaeovorus]QAT16347.1 30S ribosomal protein S6 [Candidatus Velamenicoccus archaeovorus]
MKKYEAMFIVRPDLKEEDKNAVLKGIKDQVVKHQGTVTQDQVWAERRKLAYDLFPIGGGTRYKEGLYYLVNFDVDPLVVNTLKSAYGLNENILRYIILKIDEKKAA